MPSEAVLRKKAKDEILRQRGIVWFAPRVRYGIEKDIFGVYDCLLIYPPNVLIIPIQITTMGNVRARERKIKRFMKKFKVNIFSQIFAYDKKQKKFRVFNIYNAKIKATEN